MGNPEEEEDTRPQRRNSRRSSSVKPAIAAPSSTTKNTRSTSSKVTASKSTVIFISSWRDAPKYQRLPCIEIGYRVNHTLTDALWSWFTLHGDTINIWTHFLGFCYFIWAIFHVREVLTKTNATTSEFWTFGFYIFCALFQFASSTIYHTVRCINAWYDDIFLRLDVAGISAMIIGSYSVGLHQGFFCQIEYAFAYAFGLLAILSISAFMAFQPGFQTAEWDCARNTALSAAVVFGLIPSTHWAFHCEFHCLAVVSWAMLGMFLNYFTGFLFFSTRFPERYFPTTFDIVGSSHQIWHCFVVTAGIAWLHGMLGFHEWRSAHLTHCESGYEIPST